VIYSATSALTTSQTCGDILYVDIPKSHSPQALEQLRAKFEQHGPSANSNSSSAQGGPSSQVPVLPLSSSSSQRTLTEHETIPQTPSAINTKPVTSSVELGHRTPVKRYFELCVNTSILNIRLGEISLTRSTARGETQEVKSDAEFFHEIYKQYFRIRARKWVTWLYKPIDIKFVRFHLFDGHRVGIFDEGKLSIPPVEEVLSERYHYYECPLDPAEPVDKRTFLHFFWNAERHRHSPCNVWMNRMPKKLNSSMFKQDSQFGPHMGWGVHIIEGPNRPVIASIFAIFIMLSFIISVVWAVVMQTQESGFGIGQWMVAALTAGFSAFYFRLAEG
jgi:hypothetical protein